MTCPLVCNGMTIMRITNQLTFRVESNLVYKKESMPGAINMTKSLFVWYRVVGSSRVATTVVFPEWT